MLIEDEIILDVARRAGSARAAAAELGVRASYVSNRLYLMRSRGVDGVPRFKAGRPRTLPRALQVTRWRWVRLRTVAHREPLDGDVLCCGRRASKAMPIAEPAALRGKVCERCWPVKDHPPQSGPLPSAYDLKRLQVGAEVAPGSAVFLQHADGGWQHADTGDVFVGEPLRWWFL